jgi:hypothetical protein
MNRSRDLFTNIHNTPTRFRGHGAGRQHRRLDGTEVALAERWYRAVALPTPSTRMRVCILDLHDRPRWTLPVCAPHRCMVDSLHDFDQVAATGTRPRARALPRSRTCRALPHIHDERSRSWRIWSAAATRRSRDRAAFMADTPPDVRTRHERCFRHRSPGTQLVGVSITAHSRWSTRRWRSPGRAHPRVVRDARPHDARWSSRRRVNPWEWPATTRRVRPPRSRPSGWSPPRSATGRRAETSCTRR